MKKKIFYILVFIILFPYSLIPLFPFRADQLRIGILRHGESSQYDPYPTVWRDAARALEGATSIEADPMVKEIIDASADDLGRHALIFWVLTGRLNIWSASERKNLKNWVVLGGGTMVIMGAEGIGGAAERRSGAEKEGDLLDKQIRGEIEAIFEGSKLEIIPQNHAIFKSFYLARRVGGVLERSRVLYGIKTGERYGVIYSRNDLLGTLLRDSQGSYLFGCYPGGEDQRKESFKLIVNIFLYALTGTYKQDVIHAPFIEQKLKH
ncbi:MAG: DUF4159 domain-containing protein [Elusimicrobia bacterium]|nr:DUF4159 domain-containing protein [Elusimicrobiota bacterium]